MMMMGWIDECVERLKKLWFEGLSVSQIVVQFGGVSCNVVIGKVYCFCLLGCVKVGGVVIVCLVKCQIVVVVFCLQFFMLCIVICMVICVQGVIMLKEEVEMEVYYEIEVQLVLNVVVLILCCFVLMELIEWICKWLVGDLMKDDFYFCGNDSLDSLFYCIYYVWLVYQLFVECCCVGC